MKIRIRRDFWFLQLYRFFKRLQLRASFFVPDSDAAYAAIGKEILSSLAVGTAEGPDLCRVARFTLIWAPLALVGTAALALLVGLLIIGGVFAIYNYLSLGISPRVEEQALFGNISLGILAFVATCAAFIGLVNFAVYVVPRLIPRREKVAAKKISVPNLGATKILARTGDLARTLYDSVHERWCVKMEVVE